MLPPDIFESGKKIGLDPRILLVQRAKVMVKRCSYEHKGCTNEVVK